MLLMVLMRWPSLIIIGAASVGGTLIYRELNHHYDWTEQIQMWYRSPEPTPVVAGTPKAVDFQLVKGTPTVARIEPAQVEPQLAPVDLPTPSHSVRAAFALSLEKEEKAPVKKVDVNYSQRYLVQKGDTLTKIINRLRVPAELRDDAMFSLLLANQRAFQNFDPNKLIEGSVLSIPQLASNGN